MTSAGNVPTPAAERSIDAVTVKVERAAPLANALTPIADALCEHPEYLNPSG